VHLLPPRGLLGEEHTAETMEFCLVPFKNTAGEVSAEELQRAILCAQQMLLSEVISTEAWCRRITQRPQG
jgi:hypothetical protein